MSEATRLYVDFRLVGTFVPALTELYWAFEVIMLLAVNEP